MTRGNFRGLDERWGHAAPSLVRARRDARVPSVDSMDDPLPLDRHHPFLQPVFVSTAQIAATLTPTRSAALRRDHDHRNQ
jgi:hypothetical protein